MTVDNDLVFTGGKFWEDQSWVTFSCLIVDNLSSLFIPQINMNGWHDKIRIYFYIQSRVVLLFELQLLSQNVMEDIILMINCSVVVFAIVSVDCLDVIWLINYFCFTTSQ